MDFSYNRYDTDDRLALYLQDLQDSIAAGGDLLHPMAYMKKLGVKFTEPKRVEGEERKAIEDFDTRFDRELGDRYGRGFQKEFPTDAVEQDRFIKMMKSYLAALGKRMI